MELGFLKQKCRRPVSHNPARKCRLMTLCLANRRGREIRSRGPKTASDKWIGNLFSGIKGSADVQWRIASRTNARSLLSFFSIFLLSDFSLASLATGATDTLSPFQDVIKLETQYWTLVDIPRQEKQETVPAFVLRACSIMEKTHKSGEGVKTSARLAEEAETKRERIERLESEYTKYE